MSNELTEQMKETYGEVTAQDAEQVKEFDESLKDAIGKSGLSEEQTEIVWLKNEIVWLKNEIAMLQSHLSGVYKEQFKLLAALANAAVKLRMPVLVSKTPEDEPTAEGWKSLYIKTPSGQMRWDFHDCQEGLFSHHVEADVKFDGHTTEQKYERLARAFK